MSVIDSVRVGLGLVRSDLYSCWECDATFLAATTPDECVYCGSSELKTI